MLVSVDLVLDARHATKQKRNTTIVCWARDKWYKKKKKKKKGVNYVHPHSKQGGNNMNMNGFAFFLKLNKQQEGGRPRITQGLQL